MPPWVLLHIPHASFRIPEEVRNQFLVDDVELASEHARLVDQFADLLYLDGNCSTPNIRATVSRLVVDAERFPDDAMEGAARHGFGAVYEKTTKGTSLRRTLTDRERALLLARHAAHHARLAAAVQAILDEHGRCLLIDGHTFPDEPLPFEVSGRRAARPDVCIGTDPFHTKPTLARHFRRAFAAAGWSVATNRPFRGTLVPSAFYQQDARVQSIMVEVNRRVCRDESGPVDDPDHAVARRVRACIGTAVAGYAQKARKIRAPERAKMVRIPGPEVRVFRVCDGGTLDDADANEDYSRAAAFDYRVYGWSNSAKEMASIARYFQPLSWLVCSLYGEAREPLRSEVDELKRDVLGMQEDLEVGEEEVDESVLEAERARLVRLQAKLDSMPGSSEEGAWKWLESFDDARFRQQIAPRVEAWLRDGLSVEELDYADELESPQGSALAYFRDSHPTLVPLLGVRVVEGEHPGSSYYAAELRSRIDVANAAALDHGAPPRFVPSSDVCGPDLKNPNKGSKIKQAKLSAYRETVYEVRGPMPMRLVIGKVCVSLRKLYTLWGLDSCVFVTAFNPSGSATKAPENRQRNEELRKDLQRRRLTFFEGRGAHPSNGWPPEPSFLVLGVGIDSVRALGEQWGQDAVVWAGADAVPRLVTVR